MAKRLSSVQQLRTSLLLDSATRKILEKPKAPEMRTVEKGIWTYREVNPPSIPTENGKKDSQA
jgi:hypothetical protein